MSPELVLDPNGACFFAEIPFYDCHGLEARSLYLPTYEEFQTMDIRQHLLNVFAPHEWCKAWGWTAFLITSGDQPPTFCSFLNSPPHFIYSDKDKTFSLDSLGTRLYQNLADDLQLAVHTLNLALNISNLKPALPQVFRINRTHRTLHDANRSTRITQQWYRVWLGLLSATIATYLHQSPFTTRNPSTHMSWQQQLSKTGFTEDWISAVERSSVCWFSKDVRRVGTFLDVDHLGERCVMDTVNFLKAFHVPFWLLLGSTGLSSTFFHQLKLSSSPLPLLRRLSTGSLSEISTSPVDVGLPVETDDMDNRQNTVNELDHNRRPSLSDEDPWNEFFRQRLQLEQQLQQSETVSERHKRHRREQNPSFHNAIVYEWQPLDNRLWKRQRISARYRCPFLQSFSEGQRRYDAFFNEWDCCRSWGPDPNSEQVVDYTSFENDPYMSLPIAPSTLAVGPTFQDLLHLYQSPPKYTPPVEKDLLDHDLSCLFQTFYGPGVILSPPGSHPHISQSMLTQIIKLLGYSYETALLIDNPSRSLKSALQFFHPFVDGSETDEHKKELLGTHPEDFPGIFRLHYLQEVYSNEPKKQKFYMFDFGEQRTVSWNLGVSRATDVLTVCRMASHLNDQAIVLKLLEWGIPLHTFHFQQDLDELPPVTYQPSHLVRRPPDYVFKEQDFQAYILGLEDFLTYRRGRAALMRGGFCWRLALPYQSFESVLLGTLALWDSRADHILVKNQKGECFVDDTIDPEEADYICGLILPPKDSGLDFKKSYFPLEDQIDKSGIRYGRWTPMLEKLFQQFINPDHADYPLPVSSRGWRDQLRGSGFVRRVLVEQDNQAEIVLADLLSKTPST